MLTENDDGPKLIELSSAASSRSIWVWVGPELYGKYERHEYVPGTWLSGSLD